MAYQKQWWSENPADDTPISADRLNHMEDGIAEAHEAGGEPEPDSITTAMLQNSSVTTAKINNLAVTAEKIADSAVQTAKINNLAVTAGKLASNAVETAKIADSAVTTAKIGNLQVTNEKLAGTSVTAAKIADSAVTTAKIQDLAVTAAKIAANSITGSELASNAVATTHINNGAVTDAKMASAKVDRSGDTMTGDLTIARNVTGFQSPLTFERSDHSWDFRSNSTGQMRFRHGTSVVMAWNPDGTITQGLSNELWHQGNLNPANFGEAITTQQTVLATRHNPNTTMSQIMSFTPGRLGRWFVTCTLDINLTGNTILIGECRRSTLVIDGAVVYQGPGRMTASQHWYVDITGTTQTVNIRVSTTNTLGTREVIETQSRVTGYWLHPL